MSGAEATRRDRPYYLGVVPARGGSKRLPGKNIAHLAGKPLIAHTIEAARGSRRLSRTIVSTDDAMIASVAREVGGDVPFLRPSELGRDESAMVPVLRHALDHALGGGAAVDAVVLLQPTSPLRTAEHIDAAIALFEAKTADTVTAVCWAREHPYYAWTLTGDELAPFFTLDHMAMTRAELPPALVENGAVFVVRRAVLDAGALYGKKTVPFIMDADDSIDVDTLDDLRRAEGLLTSRAVR